MARSNRSSERFKYGICLNDECQECKNKTIQQVPMRKELVCSSCGKPLRECPPPTPSVPWKKYLAIGIPALAVIGIVVWFALFRKPNNGILQEEVADTTIVDSGKAKIDSIKVDTIGRPLPPTTSGEDNKNQGGGNGGQVNKTSGRFNLSIGLYEGPLSNGKPDGFGGTITITSTYTIDLKKASGETVTVNRGDKITNVKMENGRLRQGEIHFADGTRKFISGL